MYRSMCDNGLNKSRDRNLVSAEKSFVDQAPYVLITFNSSFFNPLHLLEKLHVFYSHERQRHCLFGGILF